MQSSVGNHAVQRLLRPSLSQSFLQRKKVAVAGGVFEDVTYEADNEPLVGQKKTGAKMKLEFQPRADLSADRVSLVQTVKRDMRVGGQALEQGTSLMSLRGNVEREPVVDVEPMSERESRQVVPELDAALQRLEGLNAGAGGASVVPALTKPLQDARAIAQSGSYASPETGKLKTGLLLVHLGKLRKAVQSLSGPSADAMRKAVEDAASALRQATVKTHELTSVDPRYAERRLGPSDPFVQRPREANVPEHFGHSATKRDGEWLPAQLRDWPGPIADPGTPVTGGMTFEVAAMAEATASVPASFLGSVRWGFKVTLPNTAKLDPAELTLADPGTASAAFFGAVERWNRMRVPGSTRKPMPLPAHQSPSPIPPGRSSPSAAEPAKSVRAPAKSQQPAVGAGPSSPLARRWDKMLDVVPVSKAQEKQFGANYGIWLERRGDPLVDKWASDYLDWLTKSLLDDAKRLDARWSAITKVLGNLSFALSKIVPRERFNEVSKRYEAWGALYRAATSGQFPAAGPLFDDPTKYLNGIDGQYNWWPAWTSGVQQLMREAK